MNNIIDILFSSAELEYSDRTSTGLTIKVSEEEEKATSKLYDLAITPLKESDFNQADTIEDAFLTAVDFARKTSFEAGFKTACRFLCSVLSDNDITNIQS